MTREEKSIAIEDLTAQLAGTNVIYVSDISGLNAETTSNLRRACFKAGIKLGRTTYGSPTTSDQALIDCPSLKMGPGHSGRSHTADEFIYLYEIEEGISQYIKMLEDVIL